MEILQNIWVQVLALLGGVSFTTVVALVIYFCVKGAFDKAIKKANLQKFSEDLANKQTDRIKNISFRHSIQPIVESELKKITENANQYLLKALVEMEKKYDSLLNVLEKFYAYFDDSLVSETKKQELKEAIENAKEKAPISNETETKEIIIEEPKETPVEKNEIKKSKIER